MTPVLLAVDKPVESRVTSSSFFCRRRGKIQQNKNVKKTKIANTMTQPLKIPHQIISGKPKNPDSIGGHICAVNVTDH